MEGASGEDRSEAACLHRQDLGQTDMSAPMAAAPEVNASSPKRPSVMADPHVLAALRCDGLTAPCVIDGPINGASFPLMSSRTSCPSSRRQHRRYGKSAAIRAAPFAQRSARQSQLFFLPAYSPDLDPIGRPSPMKTLLRKADARTIEQTWHNPSLLDCFTTTECANYFTTQDMLQPNQIAL